MPEWLQSDLVNVVFWFCAAFVFSWFFDVQFKVTRRRRKRA